jgi:hypothetical protein
MPFITTHLMPQFKYLTQSASESNATIQLSLILQFKYLTQSTAESNATYASHYTL